MKCKPCRKFMDSPRNSFLRVEGRLAVRAWEWDDVNEGLLYAFDGFADSATNHGVHDKFQASLQYLGEDAEDDEPSGARKARPAGRTSSERNDTVVLAEGGVGHAGAESGDKA